MSDHRTNPQALLAATLPPILPVGYAVGATIGIQVLPAKNIILAPREHIRTTDASASGPQELFNVDTQAWGPVPQGAEAWPLGFPLPTEKCVVGIMAMSTAVDMMDKGIIVPGADVRSAPQRKQSVVGHCLLSSTPLDQWQRDHLQNLKPTE